MAAAEVVTGNQHPVKPTNPHDCNERQLRHAKSEVKTEMLHAWSTACFWRQE